MRDTMYIGSSPPDEDCAQVGSPNYAERAKSECRRYIALLRTFFGPEPEGCRLRVKDCPHDYGTYYEVVCEYNTSQGQEYALKCEGSEGPQKWDSVPSRSRESNRQVL